MTWAVGTILGLWIVVGIYFAIDLWRGDVACESPGHWRRSWLGVAALSLVRIVVCFPLCVAVVLVEGPRVVINLLRRR